MILGIVGCGDPNRGAIGAMLGNIMEIRRFEYPAVGEQNRCLREIELHESLSKPVRSIACGIRLILSRELSPLV
jgi:hypothetical protein